jgi:hypothetical protein
MTSQEDGAPSGGFKPDGLRESMQRHEAERIRDAILEGYRDAIEGRTVEYRGNLRRLMKQRRV